MSGIPFEFSTPVSFFEKAGEQQGRQRRIGGLVSTESLDRQNEVVLQRGLDFSDFIKSGWWNDNHSKDTAGILGYPERVQLFEKGERLPDGDVAPVRGTWAEGYLLDTQKADQIWELGNALQKSGRRLGFSIEGKVERRSGKDQKTIAKARVRNVAITSCPVNTDTRLEVLAKSLRAIEEAEDTDLDRAYAAFEKALTVGGANGSLPVGPQTGAGAGQVLAPESLEHDAKDPYSKKTKKKKLSKSEAVAFVLTRYPGMSASAAGRIVDLTIQRSAT
jgi:hypothetical protein